MLGISIFLLIMGFFYLTYRYFNNDSEPILIGCSGNVNLQYTEPFNTDEQLLYPSGSIRKPFELTNDSNCVVSYKVYIRNLNGDLKNHVIFKIYSGDTLLYSEDATHFTRENAYGSETPLLANNSKTYDIEIVIKEDIGNDYENKMLDFDLVVTPYNPILKTE
ncbi:hypothetical protein [Haloplasma contractile]|uniref:DUF1616 domain-containing protein n=1 Tax=Haloplasma contractile SSD-17B TaxID=1033810 RepID=U2FI99_9MOLU|nr:hypothetical protein [Haloplasma contractile]ERJ10949.1 hypothetical protein HLPCO_003072 [Haloplasma contractile SSD-17B]